MVTGTQRFMYAGMALLAAVIGLTSLRYLLPDAPGGALPVLANANAMPWLALHAGFGAVALLIGPVQFLPGFRRRFTSVHRAMGVTYAVSATVSAVAGIILALGITSGPVAAAGFGLLGVVWLGATAMAVRAVIAGRFAEHRRWMVRSFALTLSAVALRIQLFMAGMTGLSFEASYPVIAFACWIPNLIVAEIWLRRRSAAAGPALAE
ncbi:DUF2306 domain-containing protein [Glycocaulis profundi]|nr:DUF2306 domain-containing protein [Glycocaulis profundi]